MLSTPHRRPSSRRRTNYRRRGRTGAAVLLGVLAMGLVAAWSPNPVGAQAVPDPLTLATTVSAGHDAGVGCPGDESLVATSSTAVTWCFDLRNDGDVALANVTLEKKYQKG